MRFVIIFNEVLCMYVCMYESCSFFIFFCFPFIDCLPCFVPDPHLLGLPTFANVSMYLYTSLWAVHKSRLRLLWIHHGGPRLDFWLRGYSSRGRELHLTEAAILLFISEDIISCIWASLTHASTYRLVTSTSTTPPCRIFSKQSVILFDFCCV